MINDILNHIDFDLENAISSNYQLKDGLYVKIGKSIEFFIYKKEKKSDKEICLKDLKGNSKALMYEWFALRDYLSVYLNSNKAIDPPKKKIHNNNYLTLFVKAAEFKEENKEHFVDKLYENLKTFRDFKKKQEIEVLRSFKDYIFDEKRQNDVEIKKSKFLEYFDEIANKIKEHNIKNYIKIFFDEDIETYKKESQIYYALKIYNKIETVEILDGEIYGLSDFNMGLNAKKPFLEHKTRGFSLPFMVEKSEVFTHKKLFDFLKFQREVIKKPTNFNSGIYVLSHSNNDQAEIVDFDILVMNESDFKKFEYKNYTLAFVDGKYLEDEVIYSFEGLAAKIKEVFFNNMLSYGDVYSKLSKEFQNLIYLTRDLIKNIEKGEICSLKIFALKYADKLIMYHLKQNFLKAKEALNLKLSILNYIGENMDILEKLEILEEKISDGVVRLDSDEFYLLCGQVIYYLLNKSKKSDKKADMIEPFLRAAKAKKLKQEIEMLYFKYKHDIPLSFKKLNNAIASIMVYERNDEKVSEFKDRLMVGLLGENIFY